MISYAEKAQILVDALPYIKRLNGKTIVIKYGGSALTNPQVKDTIINDIALMKLVGMKPVLVHGGGPEINAMLGRLDVKSEFVDGLRVTSDEAMEVVEMVLSGKVNKSIVSEIETKGVRAIGISGKDGNLMTCTRNTPDGKDIGYVGEVTKVDPKIIFDLLDNDFLPVIYPIGKDENGQGYNINGDHAATAIAKALKANKLAYLTDIVGVCTDPKDPSTLISELYSEDAGKLIEDGTVRGGMIPKLQNCIDAINAGVNRVHILDGRIPHCLLLEIFTDRGIGTAILSGSEGKYYKG